MIRHGWKTVVKDRESAQWWWTAAIFGAALAALLYTI